MSDPVSIEALGALQAALTSLLPGAAPPLQHRVRVVPTAIKPLGLGAFVGHHSAPDAPLLGRRVLARLELSVDGGADAAAQAHAADVAGQLLASSRSELAQRGIRRVTGLGTFAPRDLAFDVDFEFIRTPVAGEGRIDRIDLDTFANLTPYRTRSRVDFAADALLAEPQPLAAFGPLDDAALDPGSPPGAWSVAAAAGPLPAAVRQAAATQGGPLDLSDARKAGAMLLMRPGGAPLSLARLVASLQFSSTSPDGVGLVFRRRAADDHWFFLMSQRHGYHLFGRRTPAGWRVLASAAAGFTPGAAHRLVVAAYDGVLFAELDGRRTLDATFDANNADVPQGGEVGLLTHGNDAARFQGGRVMELV